MNLECLCIDKNCEKHKTNRRSTLNHLSINNLSIADIKQTTNDSEALQYSRKRTLDSDRLKSIYESAYIYTLLYNYAIEHENEKQAEQKRIKDASTDTNGDKIKDKVIEFLFKQTNESQAVHEADTTQISIWNSNDINVLRSFFDSVKQENILLKSRMRVMEEENTGFKDKNEKLLKDLSVVNDDKQKYQLIIERLSIRLKKMEIDLNESAKELEALRSDYKLNWDKLTVERKLVQDVTNKSMKLEFQINQYETELATLTNDLSLNFNLQTDKLKCEHANEIRKLKENINNLKNELEEEKQQRGKSEVALKHLRSHFLSNKLPENNSKLPDDKIKVY